MNLLRPSCSLPDGGNQVYPANETNCLPSISAQLRFIPDDPIQSDEAVVQPVDLEQDGEQEYHGSVYEEGVKWSLERWGMWQKGDED